ncbi:MAG: hypothetical protein HPY53_06985 [Brevinematales bacterium]|nr:hypothetical protein [Brevinematales bacterium]
MNYLQNLLIPDFSLFRYPSYEIMIKYMIDKYSNLIKNTEEGNIILKTLEKEERVKILIGKKNNGACINEFNVNSLAMWYLWCKDNYGQQKSKKFLEDYLESDEIDVYLILWVIGILINKPISLKDEYLILSVKDIIKLLLYDKVYQIENEQIESLNSIVNCGIVKKFKIKKILSDIELPGVINTNIPIRQHEIVTILNSIRGVSCIPYISIPYIKLTTFPGIFSGTICNQSFHDVIGRSNTLINSDQISSINEMIDAFDKLNPNEKTRFQNILNRLARSKRQEKIDDKILDLGIALEMMLLNDNEQNTQLALSFRLRGAWLLSKLDIARKESYNILKKIYEYRCQVAHNGILCKGKIEEIKKVKENFPHYQAIAELICRYLIKNNITNWNDVILDV